MGLGQLNERPLRLHQSDENADDDMGYTHMKRSRGRNRRSGGNNNNNNFNNPNRHFESVGPDVKIRGSAQQVLDKYLQYARDSHTSGDRVTSEAYYQYAEHYQRIVAKQNEAKEKQQNKHSNDRDNRRNNRNDGDNSDDDNNNNNNNDNENNSNEDDNHQRAQDSRNDQRGSSRDADDDHAKDQSSSDTSDDDSERESKPKAKRAPRQRRKPYNKDEGGDKKPASANADDADGVMKTLSRGRKKEVAEEAVETAGEVAED